MAPSTVAEDSCAEVNLYDPNGWQSSKTQPKKHGGTEGEFLTEETLAPAGWPTQGSNCGVKR